jgi:hypothetical protein
LKTKVQNRTVINKYTVDDDVANNQPGNPTTHSQNQDHFMQILEQDAAERYKRKQANKKIADELKEKGNQEFKKENYDKAIQLYTQVGSQKRSKLLKYI